MNFTNDQIDALQELINLGVGEAANTLNYMLRSHIHLQVPTISILSLQEARQKLSQEIGNVIVSAVQLAFRGPVSGVAQLFFPTDSAAKLVTVAISEMPVYPDWDAVKIDTLVELGNVLLNCVIGTISNTLGEKLRYSLPVYLEESIENVLPADQFEDRSFVILAHASFSIDQFFISGEIILIFKIESLSALLAAMESKLGVSV